MGRQKILIVEDDADISALLVQNYGRGRISGAAGIFRNRGIFVWNGNYRTVCCWI